MFVWLNQHLVGTASSVKEPNRMTNSTLIQTIVDILLTLTFFNRCTSFNTHVLYTYILFFWFIVHLQITTLTTTIVLVECFHSLGISLSVLFNGVGSNRETHLDHNHNYNQSTCVIYTGTSQVCIIVVAEVEKDCTEPRIPGTHLYCSTIVYTAVSTVGYPVHMCNVKRKTHQNQNNQTTKTKTRKHKNWGRVSSWWHVLYTASFDR